ncbi:MAG: pyrroline-5-carboxylate reductase [Provencibacterium sp.]|jgi:pyrroline-5-carboxylate reductase|nr:pyrroline-5-carboxylate reductase [Provencibacterium sp.]
MEHHIGFVGCGNMASAILYGAMKAGFLKPETTWLCELVPERLAQVAKKSGAQPVGSLQELAEKADILLIAVKPDAIEGAIAEMGERLCGKAVISIAVNWMFDSYAAILPEGTRFVHVMPNTPCMVGEGMALLEEKNSLTQEELHYVKGLFSSIGRCETVPSSLIGVGGVVCGCAPAYLYMLIEALADGAVYHGMPRKMAYQLIAQMVKGSGEMVLESGLHPAELKDNVCSPGGTTIRGVRALEKGGFRSLLIDAVDRPLHEK